MKKKLILSAALLSVFTVLVAFRFAPADRNSWLMTLVMQTMGTHHYLSEEVDDEFSGKAFDLYLERIDYGKRFLTSKDVADLKKYKFKIDDEIRNGDHNLLDKSSELIMKRIEESKAYYTDILSQPFDFSAAETLESDPDKLDWVADETGLKERWRQSLKFATLQKIYEMKDEQRKAKEKGTLEKEKGDGELEAEARAKVLKNYNDWFDRISKQEIDDYEAAYINAILGLYDPHTSYFPAKDKEDFDIRMSGSLQGIGATLQEKDGYIQVSEIVIGSPCWKQGELQAGDIIMKVGQGKEEPVDIVDMRLDKAVLLIRGPKGTEVRLTIKKASGEIKTISIIRDIVILEETYAKSAILTREGGSRVGYIFLPKFYADFSHSGGRNCSEDVAKEIEKLKREKVDAIVLDLRNNSGGSLNDVVKMTGLFIERGPIVQVKSRGQEPYVLEDRDSRVQYDGPLAVMVNGNSASASEILAAAIQDYRRGVIIGTQTYGKGTVQRFFDLDQLVPPGNDELEALQPLGEVKLTIQKFYRINGGATQLRGVMPDVVLPDPYIYLDRGEEEQDYPMAWDEIKPVSYTTWTFGPSDIKGLAANSYERVKKDEAFVLMEQNAKWLKGQQDMTTFNLELGAYMAQEEKERMEAEKFKDIQKEIPGFMALTLGEDKEFVNADSARITRTENWLKTLRKDHYLLEAVNIVEDMRTYPVTGK
jgi:carboxyl-terminal processing protease